MGKKLKKLKIILMIKTIVISIIIANGSLVEVRDLDVSCLELFNKIYTKYENKDHSIVGYICRKE
jgi:hypothetical protein